MSGLKQTHSIAVMVLHQIQISNVCPNEPIPRLRKQLLNIDLSDVATNVKVPVCFATQSSSNGSVWPKLWSEFDLQFLREIIICPEISEYYGYNVCVHMKLAKHYKMQQTIYTVCIFFW